MSWWTLLPATYLAMVGDLACADLFTWRGATPSFLVLLWSLTAMSPRTSRALWQAGLLGLLYDLMWGTRLGTSSAIFVSCTWLLHCLLSASSQRFRNWALWGLPLLVFSLGAIHASDALMLNSSVEPRMLLPVIAKKTALTFGVGAIMILCSGLCRRLIPNRRSSQRSTFESSNFFLSR